MSPGGDKGPPSALDDVIIDQALSQDRVIEPSPHFGREVRRRARAEASLPALRFPWIRFAAGVVFAFVAIVVALFRADDLERIAFEPNLLLGTLIVVLFAARLSVGSRTRHDPSGFL